MEDNTDRAQYAALGQSRWRTAAHINANAYQELAMRTSAPELKDAPGHRLINAALGIVGEAGEVADGTFIHGDLLAERVLALAAHVGRAADHIKKARYHGKPLDHRYLNLLCTAVRQGADLLALSAGLELMEGAPDPASVALSKIDEDLAAELGDLAWYLAQACDSRGWHLGDILRGNIDKLRRRWPEGFQRADEQEG